MSCENMKPDMQKTEKVSGKQQREEESGRIHSSCSYSFIKQLKMVSQNTVGFWHTPWCCLTAAWPPTVPNQRSLFSFGFCMDAASHLIIVQLLQTFSLDHRWFCLDSAVAAEAQLNGKLTMTWGMGEAVSDVMIHLCGTVWWIKKEKERR